MKKKYRFYIEYTSGGKEYNYSLKSPTEESAIKKFDKIWNDRFEGMYPYPNYKITLIKKIMSSLENDT